MNVLLLGSGGREHALAWKMKQSRELNRLFIAPGNAGTAALGTNIPLKVTDFEGIKKFSLDNDIDMLVVGPEDPLVQGIYDYFQNDEDVCHIAVIGPSRRGAQLEGSKDFAKEFMMRHAIPTAKHKTVTLESVEEGNRFLESLHPPYKGKPTIEMRNNCCNNENRQSGSTKRNARVRKERSKKFPYETRIGKFILRDVSIQKHQYTHNNNGNRRNESRKTASENRMLKIPYRFIHPVKAYFIN